MPQLRDSANHPTHTPGHRDDGRADGHGHDRIFGIETEYGVSVTGADQPCDAGQVAMTMFQPVVSRARSTNTYLGNGSRLYLDVGSHPEYATAEARDPLDALAQDLAGERLMRRLALQAQERLRAGHGPNATIHVYKNNVDSAGHSFGCHENYLVRRYVPLEAIERELLPFLITRQLFTGAGRLTPDGYRITQRADFLDEAVSSATTRARPMVNTRDEPHADPDSYRRLHVIIGDSNRSQFATMMKLATTHLVLCVIEHAYATGEDSGLASCALADPNAANRALSRDLTCRTARLELVDERAFRADGNAVADAVYAAYAADDPDAVSRSSIEGDSAAESDNAAADGAASGDGGVDTAATVDGGAPVGAQGADSAMATGAVVSDGTNGAVHGVTALELQYRYLAVVDAFLDAHGDAVTASMPQARHVRDLWAGTLDDLSAGRFDRLAERVDWVAKKRLIDAMRARRHDIPFARLEQIDMDYHDVANGTVYDSLVRRGAMGTELDDAAIDCALNEPPHDTRAALRGAMVNAATAAGARWTCDWTHVGITAPIRREATLLDPFDATPTPEFTAVMDALRR